jgi:hypothetical protein
MRELNFILYFFIFILLKEIIKSKSIKFRLYMVLELFLNWGCIDVFDCKEFGDLSNIAATHIGIIAGFVLGGLVSWWIYNGQEKTTVKQQEILDRIVNIEEKHENILEKHELILKKIQTVEQTQEEPLNNILTLDKKIDSFLGNK